MYIPEYLYLILKSESPNPSINKSICPVPTGFDLVGSWGVPKGALVPKWYTLTVEVLF